MYAKWVINNLTLTYNANGGNVKETSKIVHYGETYGTLPTPTRTGHTFVGWFTAASGGTEVKSTTPITAETSHTIYAHWSVNKYSLSRSVENTKFGSVAGPSGDINYGTNVTIVATPKAGCIFAGWFEGSTMVSYDTTYTFKMPDRAVNLVAKFSFDVTSIKDIQMLNIYPNTDVMITFTSSIDGKSYTIPKSASLKMWMEQANDKSSNGYGKGIIKVTSVSISQFEANPAMINNYDIAMYGTWDANGSQSLSSNALKYITDYIDKGNGFITGHDTLGYVFGTTKNIGPIRDRFGIKVGHYGGNSSNGYDFNAQWQYTSSKVQIKKKGLFISYPWNIGDVGDILTVPNTHTTSNSAGGDVWLELVNGSYSAQQPPELANAGYNDRFYLTTKDNCAMIQTGHSSGAATDDEQMILANIAFYLYSQKVMNDL